MGSLLIGFVLHSRLRLTLELVLKRNPSHRPSLTDSWLNVQLQLIPYQPSLLLQDRRVSGNEPWPVMRKTTKCLLFKTGFWNFKSIWGLRLYWDVSTNTAHYKCDCLNVMDTVGDPQLDVVHHIVWGENRFSHYGKQHYGVSYMAKQLGAYWIILITNMLIPCWCILLMVWLVQRKIDLKGYQIY